jgi:hypothetical protein
VELAQAYFNINVPAGHNTQLPGESVQALRMRAIGTQNYICTVLNNKTPGGGEVSFGWKLQFPLAKLWLYDDNGTRTPTVDTSSRPPDGMHYFAQIGSGAGWDLGTNCHAGIDPSTRTCDSYTARWRGKFAIADPAQGNDDDDDDTNNANSTSAIDWLLVAKDEENMPPMMLVNDDDDDDDGAMTMDTHSEFWNYHWMQRLDTVGGLPPPAEDTCNGMQHVNKTVASPYECSWIHDHLHSIQQHCIVGSGPSEPLLSSLTLIW